PLAADRPEVGGPARRDHPPALDLDPDELAIDALPGEASERLLPDEILRLVELDVPLQPGDVERRVLRADVGAVVEDAGLDPSGFARCDRADPERFAGFLDPSPEVIPARAVLEVDLVAHLAGPTGAGDHDRDPVDGRLGAPVIAEIGDRVAEQ